jgi:tetratricopeptide (TPR) repeat protein
MKTQTSTSNSINTLFSIITGAFLMTAVLAPANAESWELRTADEEVWGTRDIEAGRLDKGISISEQRYTSTPLAQKAAILTNLCLAHTLKRNYEIAMAYCDRAVAHRRGGREAYNNRGVLHAILGNYAAATSDFRKAGCMHDCPNNLAVKGNKRMDVAKRNLNRAEIKLALQEKQDQEFQVSR